MSGEQVNEGSRRSSGSSGPVTISHSNITIVAGESSRDEKRKLISTRSTESDNLGDDGGLSQILESLELDEKGITWLQPKKLFFFHKKPINNSSNVYYGKQVLPDCCRDVAVKLVKFSDQAKNEINFLMTACHPNIIQIYDAGEYTSMCHWIYIVMELCAKTLRQYVEGLGRKPLDMKTFMSIVNQLLNGVEYLHDNNILHRDIKLDNILVTESEEMKFSDFGISKQIESGRAEVTQTKSGAGSDGYRPPESYVENAKLTTSADIFSLALVIIQLISNGRHPFGSDPHDWSYNIRKNKSLDLSIIPQHIPPSKRAQLIDLLAAMLKSEPRERPSVKQMKSHDFFQDNLQASVPSPSGATGTSTESPGVSESQAKNLEADLLHDFIEKRGGVDAIIKSLNQGPLHQTNSRGSAPRLPPIDYLPFSTSEDILSDQHKPRLCKLVRKSDCYGFYLRSEAGQHGQFICDVVSGGAAEDGGLRKGDKVIEVNGASVTMETHKAIVERIMEIENEVTLLVIDEVGEAYYKGKGVKIEAAMADVKEENSEKLLQDSTKHSEKEKFQNILRVTELQLAEGDGESAIERIEDFLSKESRSAMDVKNMADDLKGKRRYVQAMILYKISHDLHKKEGRFSPDLELYWIDRRTFDIYEVIRSLMDAGEISQKIALNFGVKFLKRSLEEIREVKNANPDYKARVESHCLSYIAHVTLLADESEECIRFGQEGLEIMTQQFGENASSYRLYGLLSHNHGVTHRRSGRYSDAESYHRTAVETFKKVSYYGIEKERAGDIALSERCLEKARRKIAK